MNIHLFSLGLGVYSVQLAQGLGAEDQVSISLWEEELKSLKDEFPKFFQNAEFEACSIPLYRLSDPRKIMQALSLAGEIRRRKPDMVHVLLSGMSFESWLALKLVHMTGIPLTATLHDTSLHPGDFANLRHLWFQLKTLELCSQIIVHGRLMAEDLLTNYGFDERTINVVPHGNYDIYFHSGGPGPDQKPSGNIVLFFGRMKKYKGLDILIAAAPIIASAIPDVKIIVAGRGDELDCLVPEMIKQPCFEIRNRFIPAGEVSELFASAALVVLPYIEASQSGPLHLAFSYGRPVAAARVGAIPESLANGCEGLLVPAGDPQALAEAVIKILKDPELAEKFGRAGRQKAQTELDWSGSVADQTREVYQKALVMKKNRISYPGIGSRERWKRIKIFYYRANK